MTLVGGVRAEGAISLPSFLLSSPSYFVSCFVPRQEKVASTSRNFPNVVTVTGTGPAKAAAGMAAEAALRIVRRSSVDPSRECGTRISELSQSRVEYFCLALHALVSLARRRRLVFPSRCPEAMGAFISGPTDSAAAAAPGLVEGGRAVPISLCSA